MTQETVYTLEICVTNVHYTLEMCTTNVQSTTTGSDSEFVTQVRDASDLCVLNGGRECEFIFISIFMYTL